MITYEQIHPERTRVPEPFIKRMNQNGSKTQSFSELLKIEIDEKTKGKAVYPIRSNFYKGQIHGNTLFRPTYGSNALCKKTWVEGCLSR